MRGMRGRDVPSPSLTRRKRPSQLRGWVQTCITHAPTTNSPAYPLRITQAPRYGASLGGRTIRAGNNWLKPGYSSHIKDIYLPAVVRGGSREDSTRLSCLGHLQRSLVLRQWGTVHPWSAFRWEETPLSTSCHGPCEVTSPAIYV